MSEIESGRLQAKGDSLLVVEDLRTYFFTGRGIAKAVDGVSFAVDRKETLGLIGESGCGKSVTLYSILGLVRQPGRIVGGRILLEGKNLLQESPAGMRQIRGKRVAIIPQDPMTSLDPVFSVGNQLGEPIRLHQHLNGSANRDTARKMLELVRIPNPEERLRSYPHQLSGGTRQRVVGAIALSCKPILLLADEVTSALDVTIQSEYLALLKQIQQQIEVGLVFVTHDFGLVERTCDRVAVMYAGKIVEEAPVRELFQSPLHPYTVALMRAVPRIGAASERLAAIAGEPPSLFDLPPGCNFYIRCPVRDSSPLCHEAEPGTVVLRDGHRVSCWQYC